MKTLFNRWVLALIVVLAGALKFFWGEVIEHTGENYQSSATLDTWASGLTNDDMKLVTGYKLAPGRNNADQIRAEHVHVFGRSDTARTLAFELVSTSPNNDYPSLRLTLMRRDGGQPRVVEFGPSQYGHGKALTAERVELTVPVGEGEARAVVEAFYQTPAF